jgi:hypothetical protein
MAPSWQSEMKMKAETYFLGPKNKSTYSYYEYGSLVVFIRNHSAEIWGFRNGLKLVIGTKKNVAGTGVFVRVVCALNCATKSDPSQPSMILAHRKLYKAAAQKNEIQVGNTTERGNEKITPSGVRKMYE